MKKAYKLNQELAEIRAEGLDKYSVYKKYICKYKQMITERGLDRNDYCLPLTKAELQLLHNGNWAFTKIQNDLYMIDEYFLWIEDYDEEE